MRVRRGVWLVLILIVLAVAVSAAGVVLLYSAVGREPQVTSGSTLVLRVGGDLAEVAPGGVLGQFIEAAPTVRSVVDALRKAKVDRRITSVILEPAAPAALWGKVQEVRDAILDFRQSGKPVVAYLESGDQQEFYLSTACDKVFLMPTASLDLTGLASYDVFLRGMLDKIGAYPDGMHIGAYKTALNEFTEHTYTPAHREMAESLNHDLFDQLVRGIADGRHKSEADVRAMIDHGPYLAPDAVKAGLVDDLAYEDQIDDKVKLGTGPVHRIDFDAYRRVSTQSVGLDKGPRIAVVYAVGLISSGKSSYDSLQGQVIGSDTLIGYLRDARADASIKAIVLRIDSPGGSALASDVIWREVQLTKSRKPLIVSMGDVAASGGYYIAMPAQAIVAEPSTLTGSIGVVITKFVVDGTLQKLGINLEGVSEGKYADMNSPVKPFSPDERASVARTMQATYDTFVEKAAQGRNTTPERIDAVGQGRVWTGRQAKQIGLVDELGGLQRAIAIAKQRAKIPQDSGVELVIYPPRPSFYDLFRKPFGSSDRAASLAAAMLGLRDPHAVQQLAAPLTLFRRTEPLALMPEVFVN
ncbi:MAG TPA: signal peptide peptidase SppA [Vicinamibacterales bacterium]|nr:signal peptide peptidase SppA [Vicinamibacterales bacterium]